MSSVFLFLAMTCRWAHAMFFFIKKWQKAVFGNISLHHAFCTRPSKKCVLFSGVNFS